MTGEELIIYILENNLENEYVFDGTNLLGFMTEIEAAKKFDVGVATINTWHRLNILKGVRIGGEIFFFATQKCPDREVVNV